MNFEYINNYLLTFFQDNIIYCTILLSAIFGKIKESSKRNFYTASTMYFLGTIFHELAHLLVSVITNGRPTRVSLLPKRQRDENGKVVGINLGYVISSNIKFYNVALISLAPLLLLPLSYYIYLNFFTYVEQNIFTILLYIFIIISLLFSSIPSNVDFKLFMNGKFLQNMIVPILILIAIYTFINYNHILNSLLYN